MADKKDAGVPVESKAPSTTDEKQFGTDVERVGSGYAPLLDPGDPRPREVREADARRKLGGKVLRDPALPAVPSDVEVAQSVERSRAAPFGEGIERRAVIVNGVAMVVGAGQVAADRKAGTAMPDVARQILEQAASPIRTSQMAGDGGLRVYDLTADDPDDPTPALRASVDKPE